MRFLKLILVMIYAMVYMHGPDNPPTPTSFSGMSKEAVEKMLKERGVKYKIVTKSAYESGMAQEEKERADRKAKQLGPDGSIENKGEPK